MPVLKYRPDESSSWQTVGITADGYTKEETDALLVNKAPAGYGLGNGSSKHLTSSDNLDEISGSGWYFWYNDVPAGAPDDYCTMRVDTGYNGSLVWCHQHIWRAGRNEERVRGFLDDGSEWSEWEWVNPPMMPREEYRTTERFLGKPVYVKAVSIDGLPNNSIKTFQWSDSYINRPFFVTGYAMRSNGGSYMSLPTDVYHSLSGSPMSGKISISAIEKQIAIKTDFDATSFDTVTVCVKYTKTTD